MKARICGYLVEEEFPVDIMVKKVKGLDDELISYGFYAEAIGKCIYITAYSNVDVCAIESVTANYLRNLKKF